jgi:hypothetical protein
MRSRFSPAKGSARDRRGRPIALAKDLDRHSDRQRCLHCYGAAAVTRRPPSSSRLVARAAEKGVPVLLDQERASRREDQGVGRRLGRVDGLTGPVVAGARHDAKRRQVSRLRA